MPKILSYTPPWLSRPSPGAQIFSDAANTSSSHTSGILKRSDAALNGHNNASSYKGPHRTIAQRGTEIFVAVGNHIRWADLRRLKDDWADIRERKGTELHATINEDSTLAESNSYKVLNAPVYEPIRQLILSPSGEFLAVLTAHTVHIAVPPTTSRLEDRDDSPIKLKTHQLGPTTHVIPQSEVVAALWHPLSVSSAHQDCLVTVTADAAVRIWELNRNNLWSFDRPALAIDLIKLIDGSSCDEDFEPAGFGKSRGFSPDAFDMEVVSACFGGQGRNEEHGWASMTLWVAMKTGDVYALCPLLPSKWRAAGTMISSLSTAVVSRVSASSGESNAGGDEQRMRQQQFQWAQELDQQDPFTSPAEAEGPNHEEVYTRPANPSPIPRLQGPFQCEALDELEDFELTDIYIIAAKVDANDLLSGEDEDYPDVDAMAAEGLSATIINLLTNIGRVYVCLDLEGVEGQWLPKTKKTAFSMSTFNPTEILLAEILETVEPSQISETVWPVFSGDIQSRYNVFVTTATNVTYIALEDWAQSLEKELEAPDTEGAGLRLKGFIEGTLIFREQVLPSRSDVDSVPPSEHLSATLLFQDPEIGYFLLTGTSSRPFAAIFDAPSEISAIDTSTTPLLLGPAGDELELLPPPPRSPYQPPETLYTQPSLKYLHNTIPARHKAALQQEIRLSPQTLDVMTNAHRLLSTQTHTLERTAADLFRRCERLQSELKDQVKHMTALVQKIQQSKQNEQPSPTERIQVVKEKQQQLLERYEAVRKKLGRDLGGRDLSAKEVAWVSEIRKLGEAVGINDGKEGEQRGTRRRGVAKLEARYETLKEYAEDLLAQAETYSQPADTQQGHYKDSRPSTATATTASLSQSHLPINPKSTKSPSRRPSSASSATEKIPPRLQKARINEAMGMLEREEAVIEAMAARLQRLNTGVSVTG